MGLYLALTGGAFAADRTDQLLRTFREAGLIDISASTLGNLKINYSITAAAQKILEEKKFDVADQNFDREKYFAFITTRFNDGVTYLQKLVTDAPVREAYVIIDDFGDERKSNAGMAKTGSRVLQLDVLRWHKMSVGHRSYIADVTGIHEFTHTENYSMDDQEVKQHREMIAVVFEGLNYIRVFGEEKFAKNYLQNLAGPAPKAAQVLSETLMQNNVLRYVMHSLFAYSPKRETLEKFAAEYLRNKLTGDAGFDAAAKAVGLVDGRGVALTFQKVREELAARLEVEARTSADL